MDRGAEQGSAVITREDWLAALEQAEREAHAVPESDAVSVKEFAAMMGIHRLTAQLRLDQLVATGRAQKTTKRVRRASGVPITVPAYRLLKQC